jgi:purine nucleoside permease
VVAGIAGIDPEDASIGSAAWAHYVVDGDLNHEIDPREAPKGWSTGYFALESSKPYDPKRPPSQGEVFELNRSLADWAYEKTSGVELPDSPDLQKERARYKGYPNAQKPPFVLKGDNLAAMTFWHGKLLNEWAEKWVGYWTDGKGEFVTSAMEDTGSYSSLNYLTPTGKVDKNRFMVLRTGSNYTVQPPGQSAADHLLQENAGYAGLSASVESAYRVGSVIIDEIVGHWDQYRDQVPGAAPAQ